MDTSPLASFRTGYTGGDFLTHNYRISAEVNARGGRLLDELNDHMALFVQVERAFVSPLFDPASLVANHAIGQIRKDNLVLVVLKQMRDGLPHREGQYMGRDHIDRPVQILGAGFEVNGVLRLHPSVDLNNFLRTTPEQFIPLFDATATYVAQHEIVFGGGAILLNRSQIELLFVGDR